MSKLFIKDLVQQSSTGTLTLKIVSIGAPEPNKADKLMRAVTFTLASTGAQHVEKIFDSAFRYDLKGAKPGDMIEASMKDNGFVGYRIIDGETIPTNNNSTQVREERIATKLLTQEDEKWDKIALSKIACVFMEAAIRNGKTPKEAHDIAREAYGLHDSLVESLWNAQKQRYE